MTAPDYHVIPCHQCGGPVTVPAQLSQASCCTCWSKQSDPYYDPCDNDRPFIYKTVTIFGRKTL